MIVFGLAVLVIQLNFLAQMFWSQTKWVRRLPPERLESELRHRGLI